MITIDDLRVLVIEDEADSEMVLSTTLQYGGIQSWSVGSAEAGLEALNELPINLLLVDLALPGMDGWAFLEAIRANPDTAQIPAVVVSAYMTPSIMQQALQAGFLAGFRKPIDTSALVGDLMNLLG
jgi:CheY-like chemotaxis protein